MQATPPSKASRRAGPYQTSEQQHTPGPPRKQTQGCIDKGEYFMDQGKGRRTRRRSEVKLEAAQRTASMREWLHDRFAAAQQRNAAAAHARPSGLGVTAHMKAISQEAARREPEWVVQHSHPNRQTRRLRDGKLSTGTNQPYVNPARDLKRGRRLRGSR